MRINKSKIIIYLHELKCSSLVMDISQKKIENTILYFANRSNNKIDRMKLIKLIWLSDRLHLNKYGRLILNDKYKALPNGPIASLTLNMTNQNLPGAYKVEGYSIISIKDFDRDYFSKSDLKIMEYVWNNFKNYSSIEFSDYSHEFPEWKRFEKELNAPFTPDAYDIVIQDFFEFPESSDFSDILNEETIMMSKEEFSVKNSFQSFLN